jgi:hypothetical protein
LRFQGILQRPKNSNPIAVKVKLANVKTQFQTNYQTGIFTVDDNGIWTGRVTFSNVTPGGQYTLYVKGPKHLQKKICDNNPSETYPATYYCDQGRIVLREGENNLDLSKILLLIGDLPDQDGIVNSYDTSLVRNNLGRSDEEALRLADVNFDGIVNTQDHSLIIAALSIRTDEGEPTVAATSVGGPSSTNATSTLESGASGDLVRDGSTYPVYLSVSFLDCPSIVNPVNTLSLSLLSQSRTYTNVILANQRTPLLLVGDNININQLLAKDLNRGDSDIYFASFANIKVEATGIGIYQKNLNEADFYSVNWCTDPQGCDVSEPQLQNKKFIYINSLQVCGL